MLVATHNTEHATQHATRNMRHAHGTQSTREAPEDVPCSLIIAVRVVGGAPMHVSTQGTQVMQGIHTWKRATFVCKVRRDRGWNHNQVLAAGKA